VQHFEAELRVVAQEATDFNERPGVDNKERIDGVELLGFDALAELLFDDGDDLVRFEFWHRDRPEVVVQPSRLHRSRRDARTTIGWLTPWPASPVPWFSWRRRRPFPAYSPRRGAGHSRSATGSAPRRAGPWSGSSCRGPCPGCASGLRGAPRAAAG